MARVVARRQGLQVTSSPGADPHVLLLVEPLSGHTWRAVSNGGSLVAARWLGTATAPPSVRTGPDAATGTWPVWAGDPNRVDFALLHPALVPVLGLARTEAAHWLLSELDAGVPLRRLLALARLTPLQAAAVIDGVLAPLAALHDHEHWHGRVHANNVHVSPTGQVRVSDWGPALLAPGPLDGHRQADLSAATRLAGELAAAARLPQHRAGSRQAQLQDEVERRANGSHLDGGNPPALLRDADERARAAAELATIVQTLRRSRRAHAPAPVPAPNVPAPDDPAPNVPAQRPPSEPMTTREVPTGPPGSAPVPLVSAGPPVLRLPRRRRPSPMVLAIVSLALLGAAVVTEVALLGPDIRTSWARLTDAPADDGRDPRTVAAGNDAPTLGPAAAGAVTRVAVRPMSTCVPGQVCDLRVSVQVWPDDSRRIPVAWSITVVDSCTGERTRHPGGAAKVPVGADRVDGLTHVLLPESPALAVVAVTAEPARAASAPLLVPARAGPC